AGRRRSRAGRRRSGRGSVAPTPCPGRRPRPSPAVRAPTAASTTASSSTAWRAPPYVCDGRRPGLSRSAASDAVGLEAELEQAELPELVALQRRELTVGVGQQLADVLRPEQPAPTGRLAGERVPDQVEHLALE